MHWSGLPQQVDLQKISGDVNFQLSDGRFVEIGGVASGFLKIVSVVNVQRYLSRLQLDLSNLYKDGLSFDELSGGLEFEQEKIRFVDKPIMMKASSSNFELKGGVDMVTSDIDAELVATLPVASNLPWIAALAGGLPVAAGTFIATQALDSELSQLSSVVYDVSGNLQEPELKLQSLFDDGDVKDSADETSQPRHKGIKHHRRR